MQFINLIAGILLILLGLRLLRKGFDRLLGGDLVDWMGDAWGWQCWSSNCRWRFW